MLKYDSRTRRYIDDRQGNAYIGNPQEPQADYRTPDPRPVQITDGPVDSVGSGPGAADVTPTNNGGRWSDFLKGMLDDAYNARYRASGGGGAGGKLTVPQLSQQYRDYVDNMYTQVANYMENPRGYSDQEYSMMRGRANDAITAAGGGSRKMLEDSLSRRGMTGSGLGQGQLQSAANDVNVQRANAMRDLELGDMNMRRQGALDAMSVGMGWNSQVAPMEQWKANTQLAVDKANRASARSAASARTSAYNRNLDYIRKLQYEIGMMDIGEEKYRNDRRQGLLEYDRSNPAYPDHY